MEKSNKILWVSDDPFNRSDVKQHNYTRKILQLHAKGIINANTRSVNIEHDLWCGIHAESEYCNCDCFIYVDDKRINI